MIHKTKAFLVAVFLLLTLGEQGFSQFQRVIQIKAGTNITLSPSNGFGVVTVTAAGSGISGSGTSGQVAFWSATSTLGGSVNFTVSSGTINLENALAPTGTGALVRATSPTLVTPTLGVASATSITATGALSGATHLTATNCSSSASPAVCGSAAAGSVVVAAGATTVVVNTTAVTANSQIFVMYDSSLGTKLSVTCNTTEPALYGVTARVAATSFTITSSAPVTNGACFSFFIIN